MDVGIAVPQSWGSPVESMASLRGFVRRAEDAGLHSLWVQEQLLGRDPSFEPLSTLAYVAALTDRIRLAAAGFVAPLRPALGLAKALATVDQFSLGRLDVGLVIGEMPEAYAAGNVDWSTRAARFEDSVTVLRKLWSTGPVTHSSEFGSYRDAVITPAPVQPGGPPIWIGAKRRAALDRVARLADGWIGAGGSGHEEWLDSLKILRQRCYHHGRTDLRIGKKVYLWLDDDERRALDSLAHWFSVHWLADDGEALARRVGVWGSASQVADRLGVLVEAGADILVLNPVGDESRQLDVIAEQLLPQLR